MSGHRVETSRIIAVEPVDAFDRLMGARLQDVFARRYAAFPPIAEVIDEPDDWGAVGQTRTIVLISKPPAKAVAEKVLQRALSSGKRIVTCFLGTGTTLTEAAEQAIGLRHAELDIADAAAVRSVVISIESRMASGLPSSASNSTMTPWMVGSPRLVGFSGKFALIFATYVGRSASVAPSIPAVFT